MKFPGMGSIEHLFAEKSPEKQFMNNYYKAKGKPLSPPPSTKTEETFDEKANRLMQKLTNNETLTTEELEFLATPHPGMNRAAAR